MSVPIRTIDLILLLLTKKLYECSIYSPIYVWNITSSICSPQLCWKALVLVRISHHFLNILSSFSRNNIIIIWMSSIGGSKPSSPARTTYPLYQYHVKLATRSL